MDYSDEELIEEARAGSTVAFDALMTRYERLVYKVSFGYTCNQEDSLDVTQDVFLRAYRRLGSFKGTGPFKAWLLRIAHNVNVDWARRRARCKEREELTEETVSPYRAGRDLEIDLFEQRQSIASAMAHLNQKQRQAVGMRYFESLSIREISSALGCSEGTTKSLLFRSVRIMRDRMLPQWSQS